MSENCEMSKTIREVQLFLARFGLSIASNTQKVLQVLSVDSIDFSVLSPVTFNVVGCTCAILCFSAFEN